MKVDREHSVYHKLLKGMDMFFWPLAFELDLYGVSFWPLFFWSFVFGLLAFWPQSLAFFPVCILASLLTKEAKIQTGKKAKH